MRSCCLPFLMAVFCASSVRGQIEDSEISATASINRAAEASNAEAANMSVSNDGEENYVKELPDTLQDAAFDQYVDIQLLLRGVDRLDAELLTDVGLQLAEGEKVLLRRRKGISSEQVLKLAAKVAADDHNAQLLARLQKAANKLEKKELVATVEGALKLTGQSRVVMPDSMFAIDRMPTAQFVILKHYLDAIRRARLFGDRNAIHEIEKQIKVEPELTRERVGYLLNVVNHGQSMISDGKNSADDQALQILSGASRGWGGIKISAPKLPKIPTRPGPYQRGMLQSMNQHGGEGATAGAFAGGVAGSVVPGVGTGAGAAAGGVIGYAGGAGYGAWYYDYQKSRIPVDRRTKPLNYWAYGKNRFNNGGYFRRNGNEWQEYQGNNLSARFQARDSVASSALLYDPTRNMELRLLSDRAEWRTGNGAWNHLYDRMK